MAQAAPPREVERIVKFYDRIGLPPIKDWMTQFVARAQQAKEAGDPRMADMAKKQCETMLGFTTWRFPRYRASDVHRMVCAQLERVEARETDRLISAPNGQGTSTESLIELTTDEIADAAIREIVQLSLSATPFDLFLEQLLVPNDTWFRWIGQLGHIRETKTALSGLFGRFIARAYLTRYFGFAYFEPVQSDTQSLAGWPSFTVKRKADGDLPDWVIASHAGANSIAIAEAKGSHNIAGPNSPLESARKQVNRIDVLSGQLRSSLSAMLSQRDGRYTAIRGYMNLGWPSMIPKKANANQRLMKRHCSFAVSP